MTNCCTIHGCQHTSDYQYQPIILTIPRHIEFQKASKPAFMHIFENFQESKITQSQP